MWGVLEADAERRWEEETRARLIGSLVHRRTAVGAELLWRADELALDYFAGGGLPIAEHLASPVIASEAPWQPLLVHSTQLGAQSPLWSRGGAKQGDEKRGDANDQAQCTVQRPAAAGFTALLLLASECELSPLKSDVTQQALTLPTIARQVLWFARAAKLQAAVGVHFQDLNLLRRAFVHPSFCDRPEAFSPAVGRALVRMGTLGAQRRLKLRKTLRDFGLRRLVSGCARRILTDLVFGSHPV